MRSRTMALIKDSPQHSESACEKVFGIGELTDQILLNLPMQDILCCAQRVCKQWKSTIDSSDLIQEHLFMKPICDKRLFSEDDDFVRAANGSCHWVDIEDPDLPRTVLENPFLILLSHEDISVKDPAFTHPQASWRKMLVTQPPIAQAVHTTDWHLSDPARRVTQNEAGVTLSGISDGLKPLVIIYDWAEWTPYRNPQQLRMAKCAMRTSERVLVEKVEEEHDHVWWMPDEYLYGM